MKYPEWYILLFARLNTLEPGTGEKMHRNIEEQHSEQNFVNCFKQPTELISLFLWPYAKEGGTYWTNIARKYRTHHKIGEAELAHARWFLHYPRSGVQQRKRRKMEQLISGDLQ